MTIADKLQIFDHIDEKYVVEAMPKRFFKVGAAKAVKPAKRERRPHTVLETLATVAVILLVFGGIFIWTLVGKDLLNQNKGDDTTPDTTTVPDGEGRYGYIEFDGGGYFVFAQYENSMVKNVDFYVFDTNEHSFGIEFKYNSDQKIRGAKRYYYEGIDKKYESTKIQIKYGKGGVFQKLELNKDNGDPVMKFQVRDDGKIEVVWYYDVACVLKLNEYFLPTEITTDGVKNDRTVICKYDEKARLTHIVANDVYEPTNWEVVYNGDSCYYTELIWPASERINYTVARDKRNNIVYSKYYDLEYLYENSYMYTENGVQLQTSHSLNWEGVENHVEYEYDENYTLRKTTVKKREETKSNSEVNELTTRIYNENGIIVQEKIEKEGIIDGKTGDIDVTVTDYDENGKEAKRVDTQKSFDGDGGLINHTQAITLYQNGREDKEFCLEYLLSGYIDYDGRAAYFATQNEYNENYQLVRSISSYRNTKKVLFERVTLEYSEGEDQRLIRKTTEAFDDNGNLINTNVENYE